MTSIQVRLLEGIETFVGCAANSLSRWVAKYQNEQEFKRYSNETAEAKIARLEKENIQLIIKELKE